MTLATQADLPRSGSTALAIPAVPSLLAIVAGFVDSCSFLAFNGFFVAQATGSYVLAGASLWAPASFAVIKVAAIPVFMATAFATTLLIRVLRGRKSIALRLTLGLEAVLVTGMMILGARGETGAAATWACLFGLAAMGVHSALCRLLLGEHASTNVMTTNTVQFSIALADSLLKRQLELGVVTIGSVMLAFLGGVCGGALLFSKLGFTCLLAPILLLAAMAIRSATHAEGDSGGYAGTGHAL